VSAVSVSGLMGSLINRSCMWPSSTMAIHELERIYAN
jgi:hypothetical protein